MSGAEVETLLVLDAVGSGCSVDVLRQRLGLAPSVLSAVWSAAATVEGQGLLVLEGEEVALTERGAELLASVRRELLG